MSAMQVPQGHVLYRPDDECAGFVVVHRGTVKVSLTAENGREIVLYRVRPGEICLQTFGCLVNGTRYSAEAVAETPLELELRPGPHVIRVRRVGYIEETWSVSTVAGEQYEKELQLEQQPEQKRREEAVFKTEKRWYSRWWVWTLAAVGASGVAAAIVTPIVLSRRSDCEKLGGEVCFPISLQPTALQVGLTIPLR